MFRAWDKNNKKWLNRVLASRYEDGPCALVWDEDKKEWLNFDECCGDLCQFTGLLDKNGKEIYEGDISFDWQGNPIVVRWENELGSCGCCYDEFNGCGFISVFEGLEVVGNIYENPELLEAKQ